MDGQSRLTIGDLARMTGTKVVTVRYYEQIGLLPAPSRTLGNYRAYDSEHLYRLRFIRRCRDLGFTLDQVRALLRLSSQENHACDEVDRITTEHLTDIEAKIADLTKLADELRRIGNQCQGGRIADCRIIEALSSDRPSGPAGSASAGVSAAQKEIFDERRCAEHKHDDDQKPEHAHAPHHRPHAAAHHAVHHESGPSLSRVRPGGSFD